MTLVTRAAIHLGLCPEATLPKLVNLLREYGLPTETDYPAADLLAKMLSDKKRGGGHHLPGGAHRLGQEPALSGAGVPAARLVGSGVGKMTVTDLSRRSSDGDAGCHSLQIRGAPPDDLCGAGRRPDHHHLPPAAPRTSTPPSGCLTGLGASLPAPREGVSGNACGPGKPSGPLPVRLRGERAPPCASCCRWPGPWAPTPRSSWRAVWPSGPWPPCSNSWRPTAVKLT